ncbi:MAG: hypothetical protein Q8P50_18825, partial [Bacillota bacterium]|nr:hypothetical protein [Bacillota bacterium]
MYKNRDARFLAHPTKAGPQAVWFCMKGPAGEITARDQVLHAWNEALVDGKWISLDATFEAGYVNGDRFVPQVSQNYFNLA